MGSCDQATTEGILDFFFEQGGASKPTSTSQGPVADVPRQETSSTRPTTTSSESLRNGLASG